MKLGYTFSNREKLEKLMFESQQMLKALPEDAPLIPDGLFLALIGSAFKNILKIEIDGPDDLVTETMKSIEEILNKKGWIRTGS